MINVLITLAVTVGAAQGTGILDLNPSERVLPTLLSARVQGGTWDKPATEKSLTLLHFSDLHG